jgi:CRISPR/Cas system CMR-associated protein Cmr5 small subunit
MNQKRIDKMIPVALNLLANPAQGFTNIKTKENKIESKYSGYIASFGPAVIQAGITKTLAFYSDKISSDSDRKTIAHYIKAVLIEGKMLGGVYGSKELLEIYLSEIKDKTTLQRLSTKSKFLEASIACKLAMQTYEKDKGGKDNG